MAVYQPNIPTGTVDLDVDYQNLQGNFQQANVVYGTDHYPFDNASPNQGFHNVVTTPPIVNSPPDSLPPTTAANPKIYAFEQYAALGVLQYSRGPTDAVPTALTKRHSSVTAVPIAGGATANVLDFAGMSLAMCTLSAVDLTSSGSNRVYSYVTWNGSSIVISPLVSTLSFLVAQASGSVLQLKNNNGSALNTVYWTLELARVQ